MLAGLRPNGFDKLSASRLRRPKHWWMSDMNILVCASRKGGGGKTVCARHLAVAALHDGYRVAVIDLDPMAGLTRWWRRRAEDGLELVDLTPDDMTRDTPRQRLDAAGAAAANLASAIPSLAKAGHQIVIVDTPPAADRIVALAIASADLVLVPVRPSPDDLDAVGETVDLVTASKKPMVFVVNAATRKARLTSDAAIALSQHGTVSPAVLHRADVYAASALDGRTVAEADPKGKPAEDVANLWLYVSRRLGLQACKHGTQPPGRPASRVVGFSSCKET
jgi:chromosome partitioning protein